MKWFQVDSDTPNDPKVKAIIRRGLPQGTPGQAAAGAMFLLWCYIANHGKGTPGEGVDRDGFPLPLDELADECLFEHVDQCRDWLDYLADRRLIDPDRWSQAGVIFLPAMLERAEAYAKSKGRPTGGTGDTGAGAGKSGRTRANTVKPSSGAAQLFPDSPLQDSTRQDTTNTDQGDPDQVAALVALWNERRQPGPKVRDLTPQRRQAYARALKAKPNLADWRVVIDYLNAGKWANGGSPGHMNWFASLDWLAKPGTLQEHLEKAQVMMVVQPAAARSGRDAARGVTGRTGGGFMDAVRGATDGDRTH